jgi:hypothetical protein
MILAKAGRNVKSGQRSVKASNATTERCRSSGIDTGTGEEVTRRPRSFSFEDAADLASGAVRGAVQTVSFQHAAHDGGLHLMPTPGRCAMGIRL